MVELKEEDVAAFKNFVRMETRMFQEVFTRLRDRIEKNDTWYSKATPPPGLKLAITLRHLATGASYHSLMYNFRVAHYIVRVVCETIIAEFAEEVILLPASLQEWQQVADQFGARWQFHHALGALDSKHIAIRCPKNAGSLFFNYKGYHSIVFMAVMDADYKFIWVNVAANDSASDAQIWNQSNLKEVIEDGTIGFQQQSLSLETTAPCPTSSLEMTPLLSEHGS